MKSIVNTIQENSECTYVLDEGFFNNVGADVAELANAIYDRYCNNVKEKGCIFKSLSGKNVHIGGAGKSSQGTGIYREDDLRKCFTDFVINVDQAGMRSQIKPDLKNIDFTRMHADNISVYLRTKERLYNCTTECPCFAMVKLNTASEMASFISDYILNKNSGL